MISVGDEHNLRYGGVAEPDLMIERTAVQSKSDQETLYGEWVKDLEGAATHYTIFAEINRAVE